MSFLVFFSLELEPRRVWFYAIQTKNTLKLALITKAKPVTLSQMNSNT